MTTTTENCQKNKQLTLHDPSQSPLEVQVIDLKLTQKNDTFDECRLTFEINPELYQHIDAEGLFNLKQELRGPFSSGNFQAEKNIKIEATLKPELLAQIREQASNSDEILTHLWNLSQDNLTKTPESPLFTENWFALQLQQSQESGETGYRTFWAYSPSAITQESISNGQISQAMVNFVKDWTDADISATESAISEAFDETLKGFEEWAQNSMLEATEEVIAEIDKEASNLFQEWVNSYEVALGDYGTRSESIFKAVVNFFIEDDWQFAKLETEPTLRLAFQGKNGKWKCYAKAREQQKQFVFYSVCPINTPENKHLPIIEFITRANYGMIMGNFEFDFTSGEIRYKTGIDVEGDRLSFALIKQIVYANVMMMDEYLPGIMAVIEGKVEVKEAISQIEG